MQWVEDKKDNNSKLQAHLEKEETNIIIASRTSAPRVAAQCLSEIKSASISVTLCNARPLCSKSLVLLGCAWSVHMNYNSHRKVSRTWASGDSTSNLSYSTSRISCSANCPPSPTSTKSLATSTWASSPRKGITMMVESSQAEAYL
eukprot:405736-Pyramimonas_sp.AAC.1